jgi:hypothetical protein
MNELPELIKAFGLIEPKVAQTIEYRLYYDEHGNALYMGMGDSAGDNYITIPKSVYDRATVHNLKVVNGQLITIDANTMWLQLRKASTGYAVVKDHPALLLEQHEEYADIEYYDRNN